MMNDDTKIMSLLNIDICWSKYQDEQCDRFITFGNDLKLYVIDSVKESSSILGGVQLSDVNHAQVQFAKNDMRNVKAMACNNTLLHSNTDVLFALGYNNGRILLNSFDANPSPPGLVGKEFLPKSSRQCNTLDFNHLDNNLLASGFDKARNESSIMIWDIAHTGTMINSGNLYGGIPSGLNKPLYEFAQNEIVHSLKWFQNKTILCGMNNKHIKIFDLRELYNPGKQTKGVFTKGVYGIALDPMSNYRFASFCDSYIYLWDSRSLENPLTTIGPEISNISKIEWCPTRSNLLAALLKDTTFLKLYDCKDYKNMNSELEPSVLTREISPFEVTSPQIISSFSWHPYSESRMAVISSSGILRDFKVIDRITLNWSPISEIIWTHGKKIIQCIDPRDSLYRNIDDIAVDMRKLAIEGYGLSSDKLWQLFPRTSSMYYVWKWMALRIAPEEKEIPNKESNKIRNIFNKSRLDRLNGIVGVLFNEKRTHILHPTEVVSFSNSKFFSFSKHKIYTNQSRAKALQYCGWSSQYRFVTDSDITQADSNGSTSQTNSFPTNSPNSIFDSEIPCAQFVRSNEDEGNFTRAAAVMVFNGKILDAIECLKRASDLAAADKSNEDQDSISLNVLALALSAYLTSANASETKDSLWFEMCSSLKIKLRDPYIKAIFTFLSMNEFDDESYTEIISDENLDITDRVAFACMYLSNSTLETFLLKLKEALFVKADLSAILLTGVTDEGLELFSKYIENTSDVQTISLILLWSLPSTICQKEHSKAWIENYKQLLDCWRLWSIRAQFDIKWYAGLNNLQEPTQRIHVACNYCRTPIASYISNDTGMKTQQNYQPQMSHHQFNRTSSANTSANKHRTISCNNCAKSLPRCSLCLTQLGTPAGTYWRPGLLFAKNDRKLSPFSSWFTWCQTCRHGGHSAHLFNWFSENTICPVAGCKCKCMSMDANARLV